MDMNNLPTFLANAVALTKNTYAGRKQNIAFSVPAQHPEGSPIRTLFDSITSLKVKLDDPQSDLIKNDEATVLAFLEALLASFRDSQGKSGAESTLSESLSQIEKTIKTKLMQWSHEFEAQEDPKFIFAVSQIQYYLSSFSMFEEYTANGGIKGEQFNERAKERDEVVEVLKLAPGRNSIVQRYEVVKAKENEAYPN